MAKNNTLIIALATVALLMGCAALGVLTYVSDYELAAGFRQIFATFTASARAGIIALALVLVAGAVVALAYFGRQAWHRDRLTGAAADLARAEVRQAVRDASKPHITVAKPGAQVWVSEGGHHKPLHLAPGQVNSMPSTFTDEETRRWIFHNQAHATGKKPKITIEEPPQIESGLLPLLPAIVDAQRLLVVGASDAGKTTLLRHFVDERLRFSQVLCVDPHGAPPKWGHVPAVGSGRDFGAIEEVLNSLVFMMTERYREIGEGRYRDREHPLLTVLVDDWRAIVKNVDSAGASLCALITEARKAAIDITVASQSDRVKALGIEGEGDLRAGFTVVRLTENGGQRRATLDTDNGPVEYELPGPYRGNRSIPPAETLALPPPATAEELKVLEMLRDGATNYQICKELWQGRRGGNYAKIDEIRRKFGVHEA